MCQLLHTLTTTVRNFRQYRKQVQLTRQTLEPKTEVINISRTPRVTRSRKRQYTMDSNKTNSESPKTASIKRVNIKVGKQVKECTIMGSCHLNFLAKLRDESMIKKVEWCTYIFDKIKTSKKHWRRDRNNCFYSGPLTYLTATICGKVEVPQKKHTLHAWNVGLLRKRQTTKIELGGFSMMPIKNEYLSQTIGINEKDYINHMKDNMLNLLKAKYIAERTLEVAFSKFPNDTSFIKFKDQLDQLLNRKLRDAKGKDVESGRNASTSTSVSRDIPVSHRKEELDPIPIRSIPTSLKPVYYSPQFIEDLDKSIRKAFESFAVKKTLALIDTPQFDEPKSDEANRSRECRFLSMHNI